MPGARWFPGGALNYAEHALVPVHAGERSATRSPSSPAARRVPRVTLTRGELAEQVARCAAGLRRLGVGRGDRVAAYAPNIPETLVAFLATASIGAVWSSCAPEFGTRSVVDRFAQIEPAVLLAVDGYRYGDKRDRPRAEVDAIAAALPSCATSSGSATSAPAPTAGPTCSPAPTRARPTFDAVAVRPPAVRPVLLGHDRAAEADRARPRRHHRRAPQGPRPAPRPRSRRPLLLVHHDRLDDVELPRVRACSSARRSCCSTATPATPTSTTLWDLAARHRLHRVRRVGAVPRWPAARPASRPGARRPPAGRLDRRAAARRRVPLGARRRRRAGAGQLDLRRHRRVHRVRRHGAAARRCGPARSAARSSAAPSRPSTPTATRAAGVQGELVITPADAVDAGRVLGRRRRPQPQRAAYFERPPRRVAPRRLDHLRRRRRLHHHRALRRHPQPGRRAPRHRRLLRASSRSCPRSPTASSCTSRTTAATSCGSSSSSRPAPTLDDDLRRRIAAALRTELSPRHVPDRVEAVPVVPRTLSGKKLEVPVKRILAGHPGRRRRQPRLARRPRRR